MSDDLHVKQFIARALLLAFSVSGTVLAGWCIYVSPFPADVFIAFGLGAGLTWAVRNH